MKRVLARRVEGAKVLLEAEELYHLRKVLRMKSGDEFEALGPDGSRYLCTLSFAEGDWYGQIRGISQQSLESPLKIRLCQALIKGDKFEWVVQKAVELGAVEVIPVETARSEVRLNEVRRSRKRSRWQKIIAEAVKQCGRASIPTVSEPVSLAEALELPGTGLQVALDEDGGASLSSLPEKIDMERVCAIFIGPEGGWDDPDRTLLERHGVCRVRLGPRILRAETAAVAALAVLQTKWGDLARNPDSFRIDYDDV